MGAQSSEAELCAASCGVLTSRLWSFCPPTSPYSCSVTHCSDCKSWGGTLGRARSRSGALNALSVVAPAGGRSWLLQKVAGLFVTVCHVLWDGVDHAQLAFTRSNVGALCSNLYMRRSSELQVFSGHCGASAGGAVPAAKPQQSARPHSRAGLLRLCTHGQA